jgi:hypothetical protein
MAAFISLKRTRQGPPPEVTSQNISAIHSCSSKAIDGCGQLKPSDEGQVSDELPRVKAVQAHSFDLVDVA